MAEPKSTPRCVWPPKLPVLQSQEMLPLEAVPPCSSTSRRSVLPLTPEHKPGASGTLVPVATAASALRPPAGILLLGFSGFIPHPWPPTLPSRTASLTCKKIPLYTPCRKLLLRYFWSFLFSSSFQWNTTLHSQRMHHMKQSHHFCLHFGLQMPGLGLTPFLIH